MPALKRELRQIVIKSRRFPMIGIMAGGAGMIELPRSVIRGRGSGIIRGVA